MLACLGRFQDQCLGHFQDQCLGHFQDQRSGDSFAQARTVKAKSGSRVQVRLARLGDAKALINDIQDKAGTGSGTGDDSYLIQEFTGWIDEPLTTCLWAEEVDENDVVRRALGLLVLGWSRGGQYSYWQSLRVNPEARGAGIGSILFQEAAALAVRFQGPESESCWGIVSNNEFMVKWSNRLALKGPEPFIRHMGTVKTTSDLPAGLLPDGWTMRTATEKDMKLIYDHIWGEAGSFAIRRSLFGTQNFTGNGQWAPMTPEDISFYISSSGHQHGDNWTMMAPELLFDASGSLALIHACRGTFTWGPKGKFFFHGYTDGTPEALRIYFEVILYHGHEYGCNFVMGYIPKLDWLMEIFAQNEAYKRATETEQLEYHWRNVDYQK